MNLKNKFINVTLAPRPDLKFCEVPVLTKCCVPLIMGPIIESLITVALLANSQFASNILDRIDILAAISEERDCLTRRYLTNEHTQVNNCVRVWMEAAGMSTHQDAAGNIIGRYEGQNPDAPALLIGSHLDTVMDGGKYDGMLGVLSGIACVETLNASGRRLEHAIEVIGFGDEEGVRFQSTFLGSRAFAGTFVHAILERKDRNGITMARALKDFGLDPEKIDDAARRRDDVLGYIELHIEQGPVLEQHDVSVGVVSAIAGASRLAVTLTGTAGHAGTVPMALRNDALVAASECVLAVEAAALKGVDTVGTVGLLRVEPGAVNVIPGQVKFTIDFRATKDEERATSLAQLKLALMDIADKRSLEIDFETVHEAQSVACAPHIMAQITAAAQEQNIAAITLPSGAGHDATAMADMTDVGMIFVRCAGGVSHHPDESVTLEDAIAGARVMFHTIENFSADAVHMTTAQ